MGRAKDVSAEKVAQIDILVKEGRSQRYISEQLQLSKSAVGIIAIPLKLKGSYGSKRVGRCDRKAKTTPTR